MSEFPQGSVQSEVLSTTRQEFETARSEIYFVDSSVPGAEALALGLGEGSKVYMIDATGDALGQIAAALDGQSVDAVHIYSHGKQGAIYLGGEWIDEAALNTAEATLNRIGQSLNAGGDILLYGCNTAAGSLGESFIERMARMASANVAASNDITGNTNDWDLEASAGVVDSAVKKPEGYAGSFDGTTDSTGEKISDWGLIEGTALNDTIEGFATDDKFYGSSG